MSNSHVINSHGSTVLILIVGNTGSSGRLYSAETAETATAITVRVVCVGPVARTEVQRTSCQKKSVDRILACTDPCLDTFAGILRFLYRALPCGPGVCV